MLPAVPTARPLAVTRKRAACLALVAGVLACRPPAVAPQNENDAAAGSPRPPAREHDGAPQSAGATPAEQLDLRQRFDGAPALATEQGEASYYSDALAGRSTASGEPYEPERFTAAHRKLPFGTHLRVTRLDDGRSVYVRINDRGPFGKRRRIVDLSRSAAEALGMLRAGVVPVKVEVVERADARASR